jgi:hypothetical protein
MIRYNLSCKDCDISFDSWFSSSKEYEKLKKKNFINCYNCNSLNVQKSLMSPNIFSLKNNLKIDKKDKKYEEIQKKYPNIKNILKKTLTMLEKNLLMKQGLSIMEIKNHLKGFMVLQQRTT